MVRLGSTKFAMLFLAITVHLCVNVFLMGLTWVGGPIFFTFIGIPLSQNAMLTIWATCRLHGKAYLRFVVAFSGTMMTWYVAFHVRGIFAVSWFLVFAAQSLTITVLILPYLQWKSGTRNKPIRFSLTTLLAWTAVVGFTVALLRLGPGRAIWAADAISRQELLVCGTFGMCLGMIAVAVRAFLIARWTLWKRALVVVAVAFFACVSIRAALGWPPSFFSNVAFHAIVLTTLSQSATMYLSLLPFVLTERRQSIPSQSLQPAFADDTKETYTNVSA